MKAVTPIQVDENNLTTSTATFSNNPQYVSGTSYTVGDRVYYEFSDWEAVDSGTLSTPSTENTTEWVRLGWVNGYKMFREGRDSPTVEDGGFYVEIDYGKTITNFSGIGLKGEDAILTVTDPTDGVVYSGTVELTNRGCSSWWEYFWLPFSTQETAVFDGIPPYPDATVKFEITAASPSDEASAGRVVGGVSRDLGVTLHGTSISTESYSTKDRNAFGELELVPRRTIRLVSYSVDVPTSLVDPTARVLESLDATPSLFVGESDRPETIAFGLPRSFTIGLSNPTYSSADIEVEGF